MTQDGQTASIETGQEVPYTTIVQQGATPITTFKTAVLKLEVTPHITSNNKISMELSVTDDSPSRATFDGQVGINTTSMTTKILVDDGETIVLGGIFKINDAITQQSVPYLSDIPVLGKIFRSSSTATTRNEVLIFVTPHIIDKGVN
jgi:Type II secretory pathway, component HofQ